MDVPTEQWDDGEATRSLHSECHIRSRFGYSQSGSPILVNTPSRVIPPVQWRLHVSDLSGAWNQPERRHQSRAKAALRNHPKHSSEDAHDHDVT